MRTFLIVAGLAVLVGCAAPHHQPFPYDGTWPLPPGPHATVKDSGLTIGNSKAQIFAVVALDGTQIMNTFMRTRQASFGRGSELTMIVTERQFTAKPMLVTLRASHATAAPIHEIASRMADTFFSVEGTVRFEPKPNRTYVVRGELKKGASAVWIEDAETEQPVTEKIVEK